MTKGLFALVALAAMLVGSADAQEIKPGIFRTPDERFRNLPDYTFKPNYQQTMGYRMHYLDEGPRSGSGRGKRGPICASRRVQHRPADG